jgi:hypothetical protein
MGKIFQAFFFDFWRKTGISGRFTVLWPQGGEKCAHFWPELKTHKNAFFSLISPILA